MEISLDYSKAYVEVLEFIKLLDKEKYNKIPKERIEIYERFKDKDYSFEIDNTISIESQLSSKAKAVIANLFIRYIATSEDRQEILAKERKKMWEEEIKKSNAIKLNTLFEKKSDNISNNSIIENTSIIEYPTKSNFFIKIYNKLKQFLFKRKG